jgi:Protein phosphatase 2C
VRLDIGVLSLPKAGSTAAECEDSFRYSRQFRTAAVSDGASNNFESRLWARLLTRAFVQRPPPGLTRPQVLDWVDSVAAEWRASIPWQDLTVFQEKKAALGSAATLVGLQLESSAPRATEGTWRCLALGDSCLFQITRGQLVTRLPLTKSADFNNHPALLSTRRENSELYINQLITGSGAWRAGDIFYLMTDAIAASFLLDYEQGGSPWEKLSELDKRSFESFANEKRERKLMHNDDITVVTLSIRASSVARRRQPRDTSAGPPRRPSHRAAAGPAPGQSRTAGEGSLCPRSLAGPTTWHIRMQFRHHLFALLTRD